jgi:hypothetical protein
VKYSGSYGASCAYGCPIKYGIPTNVIFKSPFTIFFIAIESSEELSDSDPLLVNS